MQPNENKRRHQKAIRRCCHLLNPRRSLLSASPKSQRWAKLRSLLSQLLHRYFIKEPVLAWPQTQMLLAREDLKWAAVRTWCQKPNQDIYRHIIKISTLEISRVVLWSNLLHQQTRREFSHESRAQRLRKRRQYPRRIQLICLTHRRNLVAPGNLQ